MQNSDQKMQREGSDNSGSDSERPMLSIQVEDSTSRSPEVPTMNSSPRRGSSPTAANRSNNASRKKSKDRVLSDMRILGNNKRGTFGGPNFQNYALRALRRRGVHQEDLNVNNGVTNVTTTFYPPLADEVLEKIPIRHLPVVGPNDGDWGANLLGDEADADDLPFPVELSKKNPDVIEFWELQRSKKSDSENTEKPEESEDDLFNFTFDDLAEYYKYQCEKHCTAISGSVYVAFKLGLEILQTTSSQADGVGLRVAEHLGSPSLNNQGGKLPMNDTSSPIPCHLFPILRTLQLPVSKFVTQLDLQGSAIGDAGAALLAAGYRDSLRYLGASFIRNRFRSRISYVGLRGNQVGNGDMLGAAVLAKAVSLCPSLKVLDLSQNLLAERGMKLFLEGVKQREKNLSLIWETLDAKLKQKREEIKKKEFGSKVMASKATKLVEKEINRNRTSVASNNSNFDETKNLGAATVDYDHNIVYTPMGKSSTLNSAGFQNYDPSELGEMFNEDSSSSEGSSRLASSSYGGVVTNRNIKLPFNLDIFFSKRGSLSSSTAITQSQSPTAALSDQNANMTATLDESTLKKLTLAKKKTDNFHPARCGCNIDLSGNFLFSEFLNAVTHGAGLFVIPFMIWMICRKLPPYEFEGTSSGSSTTMQDILSSVTLGLVTREPAEVANNPESSPGPSGTNDRPYKFRSFAGTYLAIGFFFLSSIAMFLNSTMYHALFFVVNITKAMQVLDHSGIYLLITGTYLPVITLSCDMSSTIFFNGPMVLMIVYLVLAICGIFVSILYSTASWYPCFVVIFYVLLGFLGAPYVAARCIANQEMPWDKENNHVLNGFLYIVLGGAFYCGGVYFFLKTHNPTYHVIWHIFVLIAFITHFLGINQLLDAKNAEIQYALKQGGVMNYNLPQQGIIHNLFGGGGPAPLPNVGPDSTDWSKPYYAQITFKNENGEL